MKYIIDYRLQFLADSVSWWEAVRGFWCGVPFLCMCVFFLVLE